MVRDPLILITGAGGQVGQALRLLLPDARFAARQELDVTDPTAVRSAVAGADVVIHLAADTHVDRCEIQPERAWAVNAEGTTNVANAVRDQDGRVIYVSTDYVFSGEKSGEYVEDDPTDPVNVYGRTKFAGERSLDLDRDLIVRASWIFGRGRNFVSTILRSARDGPVRVVEDQRGRPTGAKALAEALVVAAQRGHTGVVHVAGDGEPCTWADLAEEALRVASIDQRVERIDTPTYVGLADRVVAPRPRNSALNLDRAKTLGLPLLDWRLAVRDFVGGIR